MSASVGARCALVASARVASASASASARSRSARLGRRPSASVSSSSSSRVVVVVRAESSETERAADLDKEVSKRAKKIASTFAPRSSTPAGKKNPAFKGSTLYTIFEVQAYVSLVVGSLLSYNVLLPSDEPNIARLMGMWSVWMFAVPSLRARECDAREKDALNFLFVAVPVINVLIPVVWKSFAAVFTADCLLMAYVYYDKGAGIFNDGSGGEDAPGPATEGASEGVEEA